MKTLLILLLSALTSLGAVVSDYFTPIGSSENLVATFNHSVEATTTQSYNGYVWLHMSGFGYNNPNEAFDSFWYFYNSGYSNWEPRKQALGIAFDGDLVVSGTTTYYDKNMANNTTVDFSQSLWQIVYNNDIGLYSGINYWGIPEYREDHEYDIVLYINSPDERILNFGFLDGGTSDNSGQVNITLTPVTPIPEPSVPIMSGLFLFALCFRRKR